LWFRRWSLYTGISVVSDCEGKNKVLFKGTIHHRKDVSKLMEQRKDIESIEDFIKDIEFISRSPFVDVELFLHAKIKSGRVKQVPL